HAPARRPPGDDAHRRDGAGRIRRLAVPDARPPRRRAGRERDSVVCGLERVPASRDDLRAFGAAFATTSAAPMFHKVGHTPEAATIEQAVGDELTLRARSIEARGLARMHSE